MTDIKHKCYIDGSYIGTQEHENKIGYAFIITYNDVATSIYADQFISISKLNSALAEVYGLMYALQYIKAYYQNAEIDIYMDSKYVVDAYNQKVNIIAYQPLWATINALKSTYITVNWIRGHQSMLYHDLCDNMAKLACSKNFKINFHTNSSTDRYY